MDKSAAIFACGQSAHDVLGQKNWCRVSSVKLGFSVTASYSYILRDAVDSVEATLQQIQLDAASGKFDCLIVASIDRLPHTSNYYSDFRGAMIDLGIELYVCDLEHTTTYPIPAFMAVILKAMSEQYSKTMANRLRAARLRAQERNQVIGIIPYGYKRSAPAEHGCEIVPEEAAVVRRVFEAYVEGASPAQIAHELNADGIPGHRGRKWQGQAIAGGQWRSAGLLRNQLYVGQIVYDRVRSERDPQSGKRVKFLADHPTIRSAPTLKIVDETLWQKASDRQAQRGRRK